MLVRDAESKLGNPRRLKALTRPHCVAFKRRFGFDLAIICRQFMFSMATNFFGFSVHTKAAVFFSIFFCCWTFREGNYQISHTKVCKQQYAVTERAYGIEKMLLSRWKSLQIGKQAHNRLSSIWMRCAGCFFEMSACVCGSSHFHTRSEEILHENFNKNHLNFLLSFSILHFMPRHA